MLAEPVDEVETPGVAAVADALTRAPVLEPRLRETIVDPIVEGDARDLVAARAHGSQVVVPRMLGGREPVLGAEVNGRRIAGLGVGDHRVAGGGEQLLEGLENGARLAVIAGPTDDDVG